MKMKNSFVKLISVMLAVVTIFTVSVSSSFAYFGNVSPASTEEENINIVDEIVDVARSKIGFYESNINEFTTWYYGVDTDAYWCSIFVSWCADQVGALGTAVPKRAICSSMKDWFEARGEYYPAESDYVPQKGDIIFLNTDPEGSDGIHHVEIVTQSGFIKSGNTNKVRCIGGNTSDLNYNGSEYVTEKIRPVSSSRAKVVGYAHPSYEKSEGIMGDIYSFADDNCPSIIKYIYAEFLEMMFRIESFLSLI